MNIVIKITLFSFVVVLTGCSLVQPQNAVEFRAGVPGAFMAKVEKYEVSQPFEQVAARFQKMAPKCLDLTIKTTSQSTTSYQVIVTDYNPTVIVGKDRAELHVQQDHLQGVMHVSEVPPGGYYLMVFDAIKVDANTTRIEYYGPSVGFESMVTAIKGWASGKNVGCPDLTK
jgi:hypothetical protein